MAENVKEAQAVLDAVVDDYRERSKLNLSDLDKYSSSEYIVFEWLKNYGFNGSQVHQLLLAGTGRVMSSALGYDVLSDRGRLLVEPSLKPLKPLRIPEEGTYILDEGIRFKVSKSAVYVSKEPLKATLDAGKVCFPLTVRRVEQGDWMQPYGMTGKKLLSDLMTDLKMTLFEKRRQLVVVDAQEVIVWAVGLRTDQRVAVSDKTKDVLELSS